MLGLKDKFDMSSEFYMRPYIRFQPYMIGILFGYFLFKTKGKQIKIPHVSSGANLIKAMQCNTTRGGRG